MAFVQFIKKMQIADKQDKISHLVSNQRNAKIYIHRERCRAFPGRLTAIMQAACEGCPPPPSQYYTFGTTFQDSKLVIDPKSPTTLFPAIYILKPKVEAISQLHVLNRLRCMNLTG